MLAQVQDEVAARDLAVERCAGIEAVVPIDREAQKPLVKLVGLRDVEDAQNRHDLAETDLHDAEPRVDLDPQRVQPNVRGFRRAVMLACGQGGGVNAPEPGR
jgi:hypothetical protein